MTDGDDLIVLFCDAGHGRGLGNIYRCRALFDELKDLNAQVHLLVDCPSDLVHLLGVRQHTAVAREALIKQVIGILATKLYRRVVVAFDSRYISNSELADLRKMGGVHAIAALNDAGRQHFSFLDLLVDLDDLPGPNFALQTQGRLRYLSGLRYAIIRSEIRQLRTQEHTLRYPIRSAALCLGAEDPARVTETSLPSVAPALQDLGLELIVIAGAGFTVDRFRSIRDSHIGQMCTVLHNPSNWPTVLNSSDFVITMGGQTALEAGHLGVACASIEWGWLTPYIRNLDNLGVTINLGTADTAAGSIHRVLGTYGRAWITERTHRAWTLLDGNGARRIAQELIILVNESGE